MMTNSTTFESLVSRIANMLSYGSTREEIATQLHEEGVGTELAFLAYGGARVLMNSGEKE